MDFKVLKTSQGGAEAGTVSWSQGLSGAGGWLSKNRWRRWSRKNRCRRWGRNNRCKVGRGGVLKEGWLRERRRN